MTTQDRLNELELTVEAISILTNRVVDMTLAVRAETAEIRAQGELDKKWMQAMLDHQTERIEEQRRYNLHLRPLWIHFGKQVGLPDGWIDEID